MKIPHVQTTLALWVLGLDSELVFSGDAGTTQASRPSRRLGVEQATYASPRPWLSLDGDIAISRAKFTDPDPVGNQIPGSIQSVVSLGASVSGAGRAFGSARLRYFGPRALIEDHSVRSKATSLVNAEAGCRLTSHTSVILEVFNLSDAKTSDIDYFYTSRLPGEPLIGLGDIHTHPTLPRTARVALRVGF